jgi:hypothetical protein
LIWISGYYAGWNAPFNAELPWFGRSYGGYWRSQWIIEYIEDKNILSYEDVKNFIDYFAKSQNINLGDYSDCDYFDLLLKNYYFDVVYANPTPQRLEAVSFLENYTGDFVQSAADLDISEQYMLAASWQYRVLLGVFDNITMDTR